MWLRQETYDGPEGTKAMSSTAATSFPGFIESLRDAVAVYETTSTQSVVESPETSWMITRLRLSIWILTAASGGFIAMRLWAKHRRGRSVQLDDNVLILSWIFLVMASVLLHMCTYIGLGHHQVELDEPTRRALAIIMVLAGSLFINASSTFGKTSFVLSLLRLSSTSGIRRILWTVMSCVFAIMIFHMVIPWVACRPFWKMLDKATEGICYAQEYRAMVLGTGVFLGLVDILLAILPWRIVFLLGLSNSDRVGVSLAMSMGIFAGIIAIIKATKTLEVWNADSTFSSVDFIVWGVAECATIIMAASLPAIRPLIFKSQEPKAVTETRTISKNYISYPQEPGAIYRRPGYREPYDFIKVNSAATIGKALGGSIDGDSVYSVEDISDEFKPRPESHYKGIIVELVKRESVSEHDDDDDHHSVYEVGIVACPKARMMRDGLNPI